MKFQVDNFGALYYPNIFDNIINFFWLIVKLVHVKLCYFWYHTQKLPFRLWVEPEPGPMGTVGGITAWANGDCGWSQSLGRWGLWVESQLGPMGTVGGITAWANGDCGWSQSLGQWGLWVESQLGPMGTVGGITAWANGGTSLLKSLQQNSILMNGFQVLCGRCELLCTASIQQV